MNRRARHEAERALDVLDGDFMQGVHDRGGQVIFVDDWDSLSEEESQSVVYGASVAVPVGLNAHEVPAETQEVVEAVAVDIRRGRLLAHLRYLDPLHARAVALHYGLGEEAEHSLRQVGVQMGVPTTTARRLVNEGTRELRSFFALADI
jgi:DNA-directed RNA polymerase specialized sigma24 family protein